MAAPATNSSQFVSPKTGKTFTYVRTNESDEEFEKFEPLPPSAAAANPDNFIGTARRAAKTSISSGPTQTFADLAALFSSGLLLPDIQMTRHHPPISEGVTSGRVTEEQHNVVVTAFLYASSKEPDNDFHCIFGTAPGQPKQFLNIEVSALPVSGPARAQLKTVRDKFKEFFGQLTSPAKDSASSSPDSGEDHRLDLL